VIRKAVVPAAGYGTRLLPLTKAMPKEMLPFLGRPLIQVIADELATAGIEEVIIVTTARKHLIQEHFAPDPMLEQYLKSIGKDQEAEKVHQIAAGVRITFMYQHGPYGNGTPVLNAADVIGAEPFLVVWGDELFKSTVPRATQLIEAFHGDPLIGLTAVAASDAPGYGIPELGEPIGAGLWQVRRIVEKPVPGKIPSAYACAGGYVITPEIADLLRRLKPGATREIYLTDALDAYARKRLLCGKVLEGTWHDIGTPAAYLAALVDLAGPETPVACSGGARAAYQDVVR
jgi:UTP--glucose-1-phosphate uridylyltransferase